MRYRKKPVIVEAVKVDSNFFKNYIPDRPDWFQKGVLEGTIKIRPKPDGYLVTIKTLEGVMEVSYGDYVIWGTQGELYPCKPECFNDSYEKVSNNGN